MDRAVERGLEWREALPIRHIGIAERGPGKRSTPSPCSPISMAPASWTMLRSSSAVNATSGRGYPATEMPEEPTIG